MNTAASVSIDPVSRALVLSFLAEDQTRERGGFLLGRLPSTPKGVTCIDEAIPCPHAPSTAYMLTFRPDEWQLVHAHARVRDGSAEIVGWFHSHPDMPVGMSFQDRFIQRHFFSHPGQVAWIRDPIGGVEAFWSMRGDGTVAVLEVTEEEVPR